MSTTRSALITGSSRGIGLGIAHRLAEQGYRLTISGRDPERLDGAAETLRAAGAVDVHAVAGDVVDDGYLQTLATAHTARYQTLDALVVNAGVGSAGPLADFHPKRFDKQIAVNLRAAFVLIQTCMPALRAAAVDNERGAKLIALASSTGILAEPDLAVYGAAKAGLISLCRSVNAEENANGVQATAIAPGYVNTDMADFKHDVLAPEHMITVGDVVEIADACLRLSRRAVVNEVWIARAGSTAGSA